MKKILLVFASIMLIVITGCGYSPDSDDVVNEYGKITNIEVFQQFVKNAKQGKQDKIRIVHYTDEGDPILRDVEYDGEKFTSKVDSSRDKYGSRGKSSITCKALNIEEDGKTKIYELKECDKPDSNPTLLVIRDY
ncbi:DUF4362 domain-containing protein [Aquibacillus salsiterrae]|uniref:DUF4362 domain-containing protein n=1 Tax=Aquibacillus salsiterrae TaxID=2950439 RepID=A0A9X3WEK3_9BACI|nr:DUF4362 domain-containing protein [Aquibacillus salsiterrae]MDC3418397.1 DUF4362 domain-containing protein [Aquibacillus salsiterrae]